MEMESEDGALEPANRAEETYQEAASSDADSAYDVRRTEAFNLVSSADRGDFEGQEINSYAVLVGNYESGELSPGAMEDDSYVRAVDAQLRGLTSR